MAIALLGRLSLRGLDPASTRRADEVASRIDVIEGYGSPRGCHD
jgi:hypothetical protein